MVTEEWATEILNTWWNMILIHMYEDDSNILTGQFGMLQKNNNCSTLINTLNVHILHENTVAVLVWEVSWPHYKAAFHLTANDSVLCGLVIYPTVFWDRNPTIVFMSVLSGLHVMTPISCFLHTLDVNATDKIMSFHYTHFSVPFRLIFVVQLYEIVINIIKLDL